MTRGVNKVILIGNLGADPEIRYTPNHNAVASTSIATTESWRDKQTGEMQDRTEWHRIVFFNRLAEIVGEYLHKGSKVYIEGSLRTRKWQDRNGIERFTTEVIANEMHMLDSRGGGGGGGGYQRNTDKDTSGNRGNTDKQQQQQQPPASKKSDTSSNTSTKPQTETETTTEAASDDFEDDIPF